MIFGLFVLVTVAVILMAAPRRERIRLCEGLIAVLAILGITALLLLYDNRNLLHISGFSFLLIGAAASLGGAWLASRQGGTERLRHGVTLANAGMLLIGLGLTLTGKATGNHAADLCGRTGALLQAVNLLLIQPLFKTLSEIPSFRGYRLSQPLLFTATAATCCALPVMSGFTVWMLLASGLFGGIAAGNDPLISALVLACMVTSYALFIPLFKPLYRAVAQKNTEQRNGYSMAIGLSLAGSLLIGLFPMQIGGAVARYTALFPADPPSGVSEWLISPALHAAQTTVWLYLFVVVLLLWWRKRPADRTMEQHVVPALYLGAVITAALLVPLGNLGACMPFDYDAAAFLLLTLTGQAVLLPLETNPLRKYLPTAWIVLLALLAMLTGNTSLSDFYNTDIHFSWPLALLLGATAIAMWWMLADLLKEEKGNGMIRLGTWLFAAELALLAADTLSLAILPRWWVALLGAVALFGAAWWLAKFVGELRPRMATAIALLLLLAGSLLIWFR